MKTIFRNYNNFNASIFDLIGGKKEVKQTISLGFLLANDATVLSDFLKLKAVTKAFGKTNITKYDKIVVHTELISKTGKRADIVIKFFRNNKPDKALLIEAKSIGLNISPRKIVNQIENYLIYDEFPTLNEFDTFGCILTKSSLIFDNTKVFSISWNFLINLLSNKKGLAKDYLNFLTKIYGVMKFYEKEVCSIPAGKSHALQSEYPYIYECPNEGKNYTSLKKPLYFTFRNGNGEMERLFGLDEIIVFNPKQDFDTFLWFFDKSRELRRCD